MLKHIYKVHYKVATKINQKVSENWIMVSSFLLGFMFFAPRTAMAADGTQTIVNGLQAVSTKLVTIGTPLAALGFTGAAITHSVSHNPQTQETAKSGMKAAGVGVAAALLGGAVIGMIASALGQQ